MMRSQWWQEKCVQKWWCHNEDEKSVYKSTDVTMKARKVCTVMMRSQWTQEKCIQNWWCHNESKKSVYRNDEVTVKTLGTVTGAPSFLWRVLTQVMKSFDRKIFTPICLFLFRLDMPFAMYIFIMFHSKADLNQYILIKYTYNVLPYRKYFCREQWPETTTLTKKIKCFYFSVLVIEQILCHLSVFIKDKLCATFKVLHRFNTFLCTFS